MEKTITILHGDGIGPEVINQAVKIIKATCQRFNHNFQFQYGSIGASSIDSFGVPLTDETIKLCKSSDAVLLGAIGDPKYDQDPNIKVRPEQGLLKLRKELGLHTNIRPINTYDVLKPASPLKEDRLENVDLVIYRELTGGIYFGEKTLSPDKSQASDLCSYSTEEVTRTAIQAFEHAKRRNNKLTLIDKANVLETSRLWRRVVQNIALSYPEVETNYIYVDNAAMQMMLNPSQFDVILTENMFGDIISDLASVITGSLGMLPSSSIGTSTALFEPIHGSYPQAAGLDTANPMATILSVAMLFDHLKLHEEADMIRLAINWAIEHNIVTRDVSPNAYDNCSTVGDLISIFIEENGNINLNKEAILDSKNCII